jgi:hypothetical protein
MEMREYLDNPMTEFYRIRQCRDHRNLPKRINDYARFFTLPELMGGDLMRPIVWRMVVFCIVLAAGIISCVPTATASMNPDHDGMASAIGTRGKSFDITGITYYVWE